MTVHSVHCRLGPVPATLPSRQSIFNRLSVRAPVKHHKRSISWNLPNLPFASVNMIGRRREPHRDRRAPRGANSTSFSSPDLDYSPGFGQVLVDEEGVFRSTRFRVAISYNYEQPSSSIGVTSLEPLRSLFQWSDDEVKDSRYASSATVSSIRTDRVSVHMADSGNDDLRRWLKAQEQTSKAQQEALDNIQQMLAQLLTNRNNNDTGVIIMRRNIMT